MAFTAVGKTGDIAPGEMASFVVGSTHVAIANVDGEFLAFSDICTHRQCTMTDGEVEGDAVECPCHGSKFDVRTGAVLNPPATEPIAVYPVRIDGDSIEVQV